MTKDDVEILGRERLHSGFLGLERLHLRHRLFAGGWSGALTRELVLRGEAAAVLPYDPTLDAVVLIEQFRVGALGAGRAPWLTELVAGMIGAQETAEETVRREAREEAGLAIGELVPISRHLTSPGGGSEIVAIYCGRVDASNAGGIHGVAQEQEDIRVVTVAAIEAFAMRRSATAIFDATTIAALLWLELERSALRQRWR